MGLLNKLYERWLRFKYRQLLKNPHHVSLLDIHISLRDDVEFMKVPIHRVLIDMIALNDIERGLVTTITVAEKHGGSILVSRGDIITRKFPDEQLYT